MTSIRKFIYASLLAFTALNLVPSLASAQEPAQGEFTLPHEVHWQNAVVPAGDYKFSLDTNAALGLLTLSKVSGARTGFVFLVNTSERARAMVASALVLQSTPSGSYVSAMQLPQFGVTMHFAVPGQATAKQISAAETTAMASAAR